MFKPT